MNVTTRHLTNVEFFEKAFPIHFFINFRSVQFHNNFEQMCCNVKRTVCEKCHSVESAGPIKQLENEIFAQAEEFIKNFMKGK